VVVVVVAILVARDTKVVAVAVDTVIKGATVPAEGIKVIKAMEVNKVEDMVADTNPVEVTKAATNRILDIRVKVVTAKVEVIRTL